MCGKKIHPDTESQMFDTLYTRVKARCGENQASQLILYDLNAWNNSVFDTPYEAWLHLSPDKRKEYYEKVI